MNKIVVTGRLTKNLEVKANQNGFLIGNGTVAVKRVGNEKTDFINFTVFGKTCEVMDKYTSKGDMVLLEGSLNIDQYEANGQKKYFTKISVNNFEFLEPKKKENSEKSPFDFEVDDDGQLPF